MAGKLDLKSVEKIQREPETVSAAPCDLLVAGLSDTTMGGMVLCHSCSYGGLDGRAKQAIWLPGFTQLFLVCPGSQPLMISGQATPIQGGMASTQEEFISYRWVRLPLTTLPAKDPVALTPRKHLISPVRWQNLA